ncbi:MAG: FprA family A-type flavoprotein [Prolixibacteraceae bacterium]|nr:FprA family A-type flavoprotein [Prolixibacteraceae bacterium]MBN2650368.1 FprA family A-type flavoprotein [Prolixibacteraceae bacterium]
MHKIKLSDDIYFIGVNDRRTALFENFWPLPYGVTYNSYLIVDEKVCLVDTVDRKFTDDYFDKIDEILGDRAVDYVVINHVEPDHSGSLKALRDKYPNITLVGNKKTFPMIENFYGISEDTLTVEDGDELILGKHKLNFYTIPMVHWPESMVTYDASDKILFSNDAFGSFGTHDGGVFDDEVNLAFYEEEAMRYFTNIVGKYCPHTARALAKLEGIDIKQIAPSHGIIWRSNIPYIIEKYQKWSSYTTDNGVVVIFGSMYGNTEKMADTIARQLAVRGVKNIRVYDASKTHVSYIISDVFKYKGVMIGSCAYNNEMFPAVENVARELVHKGIKDHLLGVFGSYSWNGGGVKNLQKFADDIKWDVVNSSVEAKGSMSAKTLDEAIALANAMADKLDEMV